MGVYDRPLTDGTLHLRLPDGRPILFWVLVLVGACQSGTVWAGLCLIHHHHRPLTDPRRKFPTREKWRAVTRQQGTEGPIPRGGVGQGPPVFTPRREKASVCGCAVGSSAFKTHRWPKKHSSPEVPRIGHRCYTWIGVDTSGRTVVVSLVWLSSQSAVKVRRIYTRPTSSGKEQSTGSPRGIREPHPSARRLSKSTSNSH